MIEAREVLTGKVNVGTKEIEPPLIDLEATPTKEVQEFNHEGEYGYDKVKVNPIPDEYIIPNGELDINANGEVDVTTFRMARVGVYTPPTLQDKSVEITTNGTTNITADEGFDGLGNVEINANVTIEPPAKGIIINEYNDNGYPSKIKIVGYDNIPDNFITTSDYKVDRYMGSSLTEVEISEGTTYLPPLFLYNRSNLTKVILPDTITVMGTTSLSSASSVFHGCSKLEDIHIPSGVDRLSMFAFTECTNLKIKNLANVAYLSDGAFSKCTSLVQLSIPNFSASQGNASFGSCTSLKAIWLGVNTRVIATRMFAGCTNLTKIFIDKTRAEVQALSDYSSKWGATNATIICNDDEGFMTREEFDAIDWATYTG